MRRDVPVHSSPVSREKGPHSYIFFYLSFFYFIPELVKQ